MNDAPQRKVELHIRDLSPRAAKGLMSHVRRTQRLRPRTIVVVILIYAVAILSLVYAHEIVGIFGSWPVHGSDIMGSLFAVILRIVVLLVALGLTYEIMVRVEQKELARHIATHWPDRRAPFCYACQYDLKGIAGPTCPECGEKIPWLEEVEVKG